MSTPLRILILEDRDSDAKLIMYYLRQAGFDPIGPHVQTEADYLANLRPDLDVILSDYSMPQLSAPLALSLLQETGYDIPFIIITGTVSEGIAVESIKKGAADYLLKDRLGRLGQAVSKVIEEKKVRQEKNRIVEALRNSEENYRMLISNIPDVTWMADRTGKPYFVSPNAADLFGDTPEDIYNEVAGTWASRIHPGDAERVKQQYAELFDSGAAYDVEYRFHKKDGSWRWLHTRAITTHDRDGLLYAYGVTSDITERKELESQLHQSQKMEAIGRLAGGVAHDFNNLLTVILGYSDMMLGTLNRESSEYKHAEQVKLASLRAASLTHQLLAFSRKQVLIPAVLNLNSIVAGTKKMLTRLIGEHIEFRSLSSLHLGRIKADQGQVEQIIFNLAVNARDSMPHGGKLIIETSNVTLDEIDPMERLDDAPDSYVKLSIRDTGCGMDKETASHIFEPFFTTKEQGKGTGLGLSTVYGIVKQSGGYIKVLSAPGEGTTFEIFLPSVDEEADPVKSTTVRGEKLTGKETILLVEDDDMIRALAHHALQLYGYKVIVASKGGEALLLCTQHKGPIDLMVADVVMPGMGGPELAERLATMRPEMKVLFMSGYTDDTTVQYGLLNKGMELLQKPFTVDDLLRRVRDVIDTDDACKTNASQDQGALTLLTDACSGGEKNNH